MDKFKNIKRTAKIPSCTNDYWIEIPELIIYTYKIENI
jgi:hypothetical protein